MDALYWTMVTLLIGNVPLLVIAWIRSYLSPKVLNRLRPILLIVTSLSHAWLLLSWWLPGFFLRGSYTNTRFAIIDVNFVLMLASTFAAVISKGRGQVPLAIACSFSMLLWALVGAINVVV
jgi:hypothetical protein